MAAVVTLLGTATFTTTSGTKTVTATPAVGDLIVIVTAHSGNTSTAAPTDNNSGGGGTYTLINTSVKATSADTMKMWVRGALITSATSTVFTHAPGTTTGGGLVVLDIQGMDKVGSAAIVRSAIQSNIASGTPAPVLGAVPAITNPIITAVFNATNPAGVTARTGYTRIVNLGYATPTTGLAVATDDAGETSATITWGSSSATAFGSIAVELDARVTHANTGDLTGPGAEIVGSADRQAGSVTHDTTGTLGGLDAAIVGAAARTRAHPTSGTLTGQDAEIVGAASRTRAHATDGVLTGPGSTVDGSAARAAAQSIEIYWLEAEAGAAAHVTTGALTGPGSTLAGAAARTRAHATDGVLAGPGTTVVGSAARTRAHATTGVLAGQDAAIAGAAARTRAHATTGALAGLDAAIAGTARHNQPHPTTGVLSGPGAVVVGSAARSGSATAHDTSGDLIGPGALLEGGAQHTPSVVLLGGGPGGPSKRDADKYREKGSAWERLLSPPLQERVAQLEPEVAEVIEAVAEQAPLQDDAVQADRVQQALEQAGLAWREAYVEIYTQLLAERRQQQEDEAIALVVAALV